MDVLQRAVDAEVARRVRSGEKRRRYVNLDKQEVVMEYIRSGAKAVRVKFGMIPESTVRSWAVAMGCGKPLRCLGRPRMLSSHEEQTVEKVMVAARQRGEAVDLEMMVAIGNAVTSVTSGINVGLGWARYTICVMCNVPSPHLPSQIVEEATSVGKPTGCNKWPSR